VTYRVYIHGCTATTWHGEINHARIRKISPLYEDYEEARKVFVTWCMDTSDSEGVDVVLYECHEGQRDKPLLILGTRGSDFDKETRNERGNAKDL
jgi:hypothetical protein